MASTRVYILAKELGVKSSAIVKKCQDEDLDVKNHMSTISAGLAATIREWFSEGENVTSIEVTTKVNLQKVKRKKRVKRKPKTPEVEPKEPGKDEVLDVLPESEPQGSVAVVEEISAPAQELEGQEPLVEELKSL